MRDFQRLLSGQGDSLSLILGHGDSSDNTAAAIFDECANCFDAHIVDVSHGGSEFGSIVHPVRFRQLAFVANKLWSYLPKDADYVGIVESDLVWSAETLQSLLNGIKATHSRFSVSQVQSIYAPLILDFEGYFYDVWAFRKDGVQFDQIPPFAVLDNGVRYHEVDSVGSCFFLDAGLAYQLTWPPEDVVVGFCRKARELGARIFVDTELQVRHP
jgi:hypothetical protein